MGKRSISENVQNLVLLVTSVGDIDIELWSKEAPKACRNFIQLCLEGYYDGTIFHRVISGFIVQGGDPTGSGHGGESIFGHPFKDEIHSRLRFVRRGLVAMANGGPNDNGSQFFFTMGATPELMNKHTIFGKVSGNTVYNMLKLQECETDPEDRPLHPNKILKAQILANPYDDIIPRVVKKKKDGEGEKKPKSKSKATKNFKLLSFGEEAEEDEEQVMKVTEGWKGKSKSSHDLTNDPRLSAVPALEMQEVSPNKLKEEKRPLEHSEEEEEDKIKEERRENIRKKLKKEPVEPVKKKEPVEPVKKKEPVEPVKKKEPVEPVKKKEAIEPVKKEKKVEKTEETESKPTSKSEELKQEAKQLKKEIRESKKREEQRKAGNEENDKTEPEDAPPASNDPLADFKRERQKYKNLRKQQGVKGQSREEITMSLLNKFKTKLNSAKTLAGDYSDEEEEKPPEEEDVGDLSWMHHKLHFDDKHHKVLDANVTDVERYEIFDPRNPLTKRRRDESKKSMKAKT